MLSSEGFESVNEIVTSNTPDCLNGAEPWISNLSLDLDTIDDVNMKYFCIFKQVLGILRLNFVKNHVMVFN